MEIRVDPLTHSRARKLPVSTGLSVLDPNIARAGVYTQEYPTIKTGLKVICEQPNYTFRKPKTEKHFEAFVFD